MKITKRNGTLRVYDDERVVRSILRANTEVENETMSKSTAGHLADEVFARLTERGSIITTQDVRQVVYTLLREKGYPQTARHYMDFKK